MDVNACGMHSVESSELIFTYKLDGLEYAGVRKGRYKLISIWNILFFSLNLVPTRLAFGSSIELTSRINAHLVANQHENERIM